MSLASLKAAITRALLAYQDQYASATPGPSPNGRRRDHPHPVSPAPPGDPDSAPGLHGEPTHPPKRPGLHSQGRHRRVFTDSRTLKGNEGEPHKHPPTRGAGSAAEVRAKMKEQAKAFGLTTLPGEGSLTLATRQVPGGRAAVLGYIRLAAADQDPHALTWLHCWESLKKWEQQLVTLDDVCAGAGVSPVKLLKAVVGVAFESGVDVANLVAAQAHPSVVKTSVQVAKTAAGIEDRKLLFQHHGFTPLKPGTTINIGVGVSATAQAANITSADTSMPSFLKDVELLQAPRQDVQQQIIDATTVPALPEPAPFRAPQDAVFQTNQPEV